VSLYICGMKVQITFFLLATAFALTSCENAKNQSVAVMQSEMDSVSYALGVNIGSSLKSQGTGELNWETMLAAAERAYTGDTTLEMTDQEAVKFLNDFFKNKQREAAQKTLEEGRAFLEKNKSNPLVFETESGLQYEIIEKGNGPTPQLGDSVMVHYTASLISGEVLESTSGRDPQAFVVGGVIRGWTEALQMMKEGGQWMLYIPSELAYGSMTGGKVPPNSVLVYEIKLVKVIK
jgi:FKBP-type peptidyl-prolyl cis-trans isomerase FklB